MNIVTIEHPHGNRRSALCLNPNPKHERRSGYKKLPGPMGQLARIAAKKEIHKHLYFYHALKLHGRRSFHPLRQRLIDAFCCAVLDCIDLATGMTTKSLEAISKGLDVLPCRITRLVNEIMIPAGLMYAHGSHGKDPRFGVVYDSTHGLYFPKMLVCTDRFFEVCGASPTLIEKIRALADDKLTEQVDADTGRQMTQQQARDLRLRWAWDRAYQLRKDRAVAQRKRAFVESLGSTDRRLLHIGKQLMLQHSLRYMAAEPSLLARDAWIVLARMGLTAPQSSSQKH